MIAWGTFDSGGEIEHYLIVGSGLTPLCKYLVTKFHSEVGLSLGKRFEAIVESEECAYKPVR